MQYEESHLRCAFHFWRQKTTKEMCRFTVKVLKDFSVNCFELQKDKSTVCALVTEEVNSAERMMQSNLNFCFSMNSCNELHPSQGGLFSLLFRLGQRQASPHSASVVTGESRQLTIITVTPNNTAVNPSLLSGWVKEDCGGLWGNY